MKTKELKILYVNPNGFTGKIKSLKSAAETYQAHFILISEARLKGKPPILQGYSWITKNRTKTTGGGVAIAIRDEVQHLIKEIKDIEDQDQEVLWLNFNTNHTQT